MAEETVEQVVVEEEPTEVEEVVEETPAEEEASDVDDRGVPWKNVAMEARRKQEEAEAEAQTFKSLLVERPPAKVETEPEPAKRALSDADINQLVSEGNYAKAFGYLAEKAVEHRESVRDRKTAGESASGLRETLLDKYPDLGDRHSELFKASRKAAKELKGEWKDLGMAVDEDALQREGLLPILEKQAVERAIINNPHLAPNWEAEVMAAKKKVAPAQAVPSGGGKAPMIKKAEPETDVKISPEELAFRQRNNLPCDAESIKKYLEKKKTIGFYSDRTRGGE